ncbi:unnamed protein product [Mucor hiemalis]
MSQVIRKQARNQTYTGFYHLSGSVWSTPNKEFATVLYSSINIYSHRTIDIADKASSFNHQIVWPVINLVVDLVPNLRFQLGEVFLDASDEDFKADGVVKCGDIELLSLETSGQYGVRDDNRFGQDHVKGALGCLTFLWRILKT